MWKKIITIFVLITSLLISKIQLCAMGTATINTQTLNMRSSPGMEGSVIGQVRQGETYTVLAEENGWYLISVNGTEGYISAKYCMFSEIPDASGSAEELEPEFEENDNEGTEKNLVYPLLVGMGLIITGSILLTIRSIKKEKNVEIPQDFSNDEYYGNYHKKEGYYEEDYPGEEGYYEDDYPVEEGYYEEDYPGDDEYYEEDYPKDDEYYGEDYSGDDEYYEEDYPEDDKYYEEDYPDDNKYYEPEEERLYNAVKSSRQDKKNTEKREFRKSYNYFDDSTEKNKFNSKKVANCKRFDDGDDYRIDVDPSVFED